MSNMYGKDKFHDRQKAVLQKSAQKLRMIRVGHRIIFEGIC